MVWEVIAAAAVDAYAKNRASKKASQQQQAAANQAIGA